MVRDVNYAALRPLLMSYGGGHATIMAVVASELINRGCTPDLIGLTTAAQVFKRRGLPARSVLALQDAETAADSVIQAAIESEIRNQSHPDITAEETKAYFAIGYRDLAAQIGAEAAAKRMATEGRMAFMPIATMIRYLEQTRPNVVVTTTSPRFEHALLQAARHLGIPSLAISDLFLVGERDWIIPETFAEHLCVFAGPVKEDLINAGLTDTDIHITGNPAFDSLRNTPDDATRRDKLRLELGVTDKTVILWPVAQLGAKGLSGSPLTGPKELVPIFEKICQTDSNFTYILRHHPNSPFTLGSDVKNGILDDGTMSPEDALLVADIVCVETSTMGLQAALKGLPVICVQYAEEAVYPLYGLGQEAADLEDMARQLLARDFQAGSQTFDLPELGTATGNVVDLIGRIASPSSIE